MVGVLYYFHCCLHHSNSCLFRKQYMVDLLFVLRLSYEGIYIVIIFSLPLHSVGRLSGTVLFTPMSILFPKLMAKTSYGFKL